MKKFRVIKIRLTGGRLTDDIVIKAVRSVRHKRESELRRVIYRTGHIPPIDDALMARFIEAVLADTDNFKDLSEVWDEEWDELLKGVFGDEAGEAIATRNKRNMEDRASHES